MVNQLEVYRPLKPLCTGTIQALSAGTETSRCPLRGRRVVLLLGRVRRAWLIIRSFKEAPSYWLFPYLVAVAINVRVGDVCPANASEHGMLQCARVREHVAHERFPHTHGYDEYLCGCASACELPLHAGVRVNALRSLLARHRQ